MEIMHYLLLRVVGESKLSFFFLLYISMINSKNKNKKIIKMNKEVYFPCLSITEMLLISD